MTINPQSIAVGIGFVMLALIGFLIMGTFDPLTLVLCDWLGFDYMAYCE